MKKIIFLLVLALVAIIAFFINGEEVHESTAANVDKPTTLEVNGQTANFISFKNGYLRNKGRKEWVEEGKDLKMRFMFKEEKRDKSSIYLFNKSLNIRLRIDVSGKKIMQQKGNEPERVLYKIEEALITPKGQQVKKVVYAYNEKASGSFANVPGTTVWLEDNPDTQKKGKPKQLEETKRDEWSVYLKDENENKIQIDLYQKKVRIGPKGKIYEIIKGS